MDKYRVLKNINNLIDIDSNYYKERQMKRKSPLNERNDYDLNYFLALK